MSFLYWSDETGAASGQKVLLATTAYDNPDASYTAAIQASRAVLADNGIATAYALLSGNCHVDDARNSILGHFLASDCTDLVFLDADVSWTPEQLVRLCRHDGIDVGVVAGIYPKRAQGITDMPVRMLDDVLEPGPDGLMEVEGLPTGFMRIKRYVIEDLANNAQTHRNGLDVVPIVFERTYAEGMGRVGGDINFCLKARDAGFTLFADCDLHLGHAAKVIVKDSLGAALRRNNGTTLPWLVDRIRSGTWKPEDFDEAQRFVANTWAAPQESLTAAIRILEQNPGHVLETGSGLSTICMAAAIPDHYVYALEHDPIYFEMTKRLARAAGVKNIGLVLAPIDKETNWYSNEEFEGLPDRYRLGFCDGPPRAFESRMTFFNGGYAHACDVVIADDATTFEYQAQIVDWAKKNDRKFNFEGRIAIVK